MINPSDYKGKYLFKWLRFIFCLSLSLHLLSRFKSKNYSVIDYYLLSYIFSLWLNRISSMFLFICLSIFIWWNVITLMNVSRGHWFLIFFFYISSTETWVCVVSSVLYKGHYICGVLAYLKATRKQFILFLQVYLNDRTKCDMRLIYTKVKFALMIK